MAHLHVKLLDDSDGIDVCCKHCKWFCFLNEAGNSSKGLCKRNPPTFVDNNRNSAWPIVDDDDYCGYFDLSTKRPWYIIPDPFSEIFPDNEDED